MKLTPLRHLQLAQIAHHEAGHAIIANAVGLGVVEMVVRRNKGHVDFAADWTIDNAMDRLVFHHAGLHAEAVFLMNEGYSRGRAYRIARRHSAADFASARRACRWAADRHGLVLWPGEADGDAAELVNDLWDDIEALAAEFGG